MVGVPGKSKGCATCRRRKKGCDLQRPSCRNCLNSGYVCGGYQRDLTFILHPTTKAVENALFLPIKPAPPLLALLPSLDRSALVTQCRDSFFDVFLPRGKCTVEDREILFSGHPMHWTQILPSYIGDETALDLAFSALSISRVGRAHNEPRLVKESSKLYGKALKDLQKALYDPVRMHSEQVLAACQLLGLYETFEGAGGKSVGWISHAQGAARIIELRGPHAHTAGLPHFLFVGSRIPIIYSSILRRKATFLADTDWLTVPWHNTIRTGMDMLVDFVTKVPGVLEDFDLIRTRIPSAKQRESLLGCLDRCRTVQKTLARWLLRRKQNAAPLVVKHQSTGDQDPYPFSHEIIFENYLFVGSNLLYWAANLVLCTTAMEIELSLASLGYQAGDMLQSTAEVQKEAQKYATQIAQCIPYCLWPDMGDVGINIMSFPICLAFKFFLRSNEAEICSWMVKVCNDINHSGLTLGPFADDATTSNSMIPSNSLPGVYTTRLAPEDNFEFNNLVPAPTWSKIPPISNSRETSPTQTRIKQDPDTTHGHDFASKSTYGPGLRQLPPKNEDSKVDMDDDMDSDVDSMSPLSGGSYGSSTNSRQDSAPAPYIPKQLVQLQIANARNGDFTFIAEDPSRHYIVKDDAKP